MQTMTGLQQMLVFAYSSNSDAKPAMLWRWCTVDVHHNQQMLQIPFAWLWMIPAAQGT